MSDEYEVEKIVDKRTKNGKEEYKIKWVGYSMSECTWEPLKNLENIKKMIDDYNMKLNLKDSLKKSSDNKFLGKKTENPIPNYNNIKEDKEKDKLKENLLSENLNINNHINNYINLENNNNNENLKDQNNDKYIVDERYKEVYTIKREGDELCAIVVYDNNGIMEKKQILTKELQKINPFILIQFYESKIKFT